MQVFHSLEEYKESGVCKIPGAVTLGKFDGVHIGHQKLIRKIMDFAHANSISSIVFAIEIQDRPILSHEERAVYLESLGVDILVECPFSREFMSMRAETFAREVLSETMHASYVCVGTDFGFGCRREGTASMLADLGRQYGFQVEIAAKERLFQEDVSSSRVRKALAKGDMKLANALLGRPYPVMGIVQHGRHLGTGIGVPTVNVHPGANKILPPDGVYASCTRLPDQTIRTGITNLGIRPTVGGKTRKAETTLFDFQADLYGQTIQTDLLDYLRPEHKFSSLDELKSQIGRDRESALAILPDECDRFYGGPAFEFHGQG